MQRAFDLDMLACPRCGGRLRLLTTVEDHDAIRAILAVVAESGELAERAPPSPRRSTAATPRRLTPERHPGTASVKGCPMAPWGVVLLRFSPLARQKSIDRRVVLAVPTGGRRSPAKQCAENGRSVKQRLCPRPSRGRSRGSDVREKGLPSNGVYALREFAFRRWLARVRSREARRSAGDLRLGLLRHA